MEARIHEQPPGDEDDPNYEGFDADNYEALQETGFWQPDEEGFELEREQGEVDDDDEDHVEQVEKYELDRPWETEFPFSKIPEPSSKNVPEVHDPIHAGEPWTRLLDEELTARFLSGESTRTIAIALGRTEGSIRSRVIKLFLHLQGFALGKRFGISKSSVTAPELASIIQLRLQGMLIQDIATELSCPEEVVAGALLHARLLEPVDLDEVKYKDDGARSKASKSEGNQEVKKFPNQGKRWLPEDDKQLRELWHSPITIQELYSATGRSQLGILYRLIALGEISPADVDHFLEIKRNNRKT